MQLYAELISPGDHVEGAEVLWVQRLWDQNAVLVGLDASGVRSPKGSATRVNRYQVDEMVEVAPRPPGQGGGISTG
jgi:hypothetical protein